MKRHGSVRFVGGLVCSFSVLAVGALRGQVIGAQSSPPSNAPAADNAMLRFKRVPVHDPQINDWVAMTILVPAGWKMDAQIVWTWDPYARVSLRGSVRGPQGLPGLTAYDRGVYCAPSGLFHEGMNYLGKQVRRPMSPADYVRTFAPRVRSDLANARLVASEPSPSYARMISAKYGPGNDVQAAKMRYEYQLDGKPVEEVFYCSVTSTRIPTAGGVAVDWTTDACSFRAEQGKLDQAMPLLILIYSSARQNLEWAEEVKRLNQQLIANYAHQSDAALAVSQHLAKNQQQISAMLSSSFAKRDAAESRSLDGFSQAIRGVDTYQTPSGDHLEVPLGWDHYFSNPNSDQVLLVNGSLPSEIKREGWVEMQKSR